MWQEMEVIITDVVWINKTPTRLLINQQESLWLFNLSHTSFVSSVRLEAHVLWSGGLTVS